MASFLNTFGKYILMVVIAALSFLSGSVTDIGKAVQIAIDKDKAIAQAVQIINETPDEQIKTAIEKAGKPEISLPAVEEKAAE